MKRYHLLARSAAPYALRFSIGVLLGVLACIGWQLLGPDGQRFVSVTITDFVLPPVLIILGVIASVSIPPLAYAFYRDHKKGVL